MRYMYRHPPSLRYRTESNVELGTLGKVLHIDNLQVIV